MTNKSLAIDIPSIVIAENLPLNEDDKLFVEKRIAEINAETTGCRDMGCTVVVLFIVLSAAALSYFFKKKSEDFFVYLAVLAVLLASILLSLFLVYYFNKSSLRKLKKDLFEGKNQLTGTLESRSKGEDGYQLYFSFVTLQKRKLLTLTITEADYMRYTEGSKLNVNYLKHSRLAISITVQLE